MTNTIKDAYSGIEISNLPLTIQDAVTVTRALGLRYVWVDRLCIIQDDKDDREKELAAMSSIYGCSYITISAASASKDADGFLGPKTDRTVNETVVKLKILTLADGASDNSTSTVGTLGAIFVKPVKLGAFEDAALSEPIQSRGWTMQEHLLSPRVLVFGSRQLRWVCESFQHTDGGRDHHNMTLPFPLVAVDDKTLFESPITTYYRFTTTWNWNAIVQEYSKRQLSPPKNGQPHDKLIALGGLAERFSELLGYKRDDYMAGLWRPKLMDQILWVSSPNNLKPRPEYRAPSWSWASVDSPIYYDAWRFVDDYSLQPQIYDIKCEKESTQLPLGAVKSGYILCKGHICQGKLFNKDEEYFLNMPGLKASPHVYFDVLYEDGGIPERLRHPTCLIIASATPYMYWGLLLVPRESGGFEREGLWTFDIAPDDMSQKRFEEGRKKWFANCKVGTVLIK
jgi:hypothetical protein